MQWALNIADQDRMVVGVCAALTGQKLFETLGFQMVQEVVVPGYYEHPERIIVWIGLRQPVVGVGDGEAMVGGDGGGAGQGEGSGEGEGSAMGGQAGQTGPAGDSGQ